MKQTEHATEEFPSAVDFINTSYKDFTVFALQDALVAFSKSISKTKTELNHLIPKNFTRFISCRGMMENLDSEHMEDAEGANPTQVVGDLIARIEKILKKYNVDIEGEKVTDLEAESLMDMREVLRSNMMNFTVFIELLTKIMNKNSTSDTTDVPIDVTEEVREFLSVVYERISESTTSLEEACDFADVYLRALTITNSNQDFRKNKVVNTLLVNFKESTYARMSATDEYYIDLFKALKRVMVYLDEDQIEDAIAHVFQCLSEVLVKTSPRYSLTVLKRIEDLRKSIILTASSQKELKECFSRLRIGMFERFTAPMTTIEACEVFKQFLGALTQRETKKAQEILLKKTQREIKGSTKQGLEYLKDERKEIEAVVPCLGLKQSKNVRELEASLKERRKIELKSVVDRIRGYLQVYSHNEDNCSKDVEILMKITSIVDSEYINEILGECRDLIEKRPVVTYFLQSYLKVASPVLNEGERMIVEKLKFQFDHFFEKPVSK